MNFSLENKNIIENHSINVTAESRSDYILVGTDEKGIVKWNDPELIFKIGSKIDFIISSPGHPFLLKSKVGIGKKNQIEGIEKMALQKV